MGLAESLSELDALTRSIGEARTRAENINAETRRRRTRSWVSASTIGSTATLIHSDGGRFLPVLESMTL